MSAPQSSREILDREFLPTRAKILEIAAALDRMSRAENGSVDDPRWAQLHTALKLVLEENENRAEQVQLLFSRAYDENWRETLAVK
jgi:hypothetical protein